MSDAQRMILLREIFTGVYQDEEHPNPHEAFTVLKMYLSYYRFENDLMD